jgi:hypothetical protein
MVYDGGMRKDVTPPSVSSYVRELFFAGVHDPDIIAARFLEEALVSGHPGEWLLPAVRNSVGGAFSSIQAAVRGNRSPGGTTHGNGTQRQRHNDSYVYNPDTREWVPLGQATVKDFQAAIDWRQRMIRYPEDVITEYRGYIQRITDAGVTCLDEI